MRFSGTFTPEQLDLLARVLDHHCSSHGIESALEKEDVARHLLSLYHARPGSAECLLDILEERLRPKAIA
ncbi:hypothetical protein KEU06_19340 [Pseudaminobacter sp. 19-2017]|uniref:Uncharacterized protein n=1 Tax=Pseudaminobacter soli (ex Zhang et al. 2022) TaxID=2831468 RepID=A0A942DYW6_9HYPH|nr:hypothetical protein [Pseudaminobacter soli]MBS3650769.1 hypothetical protein [Pseudaminobacter soli]